MSPDHRLTKLILLKIVYELTHSTLLFFAAINYVWYTVSSDCVIGILVGVPGPDLAASTL